MCIRDSGTFIQSIIDFLIIALSIFLFLRIVMNMKNKFEAAKAKILQEEKDKQEDVYKRQIYFINAESFTFRRLFCNLSAGTAQ